MLSPTIQPGHVRDDTSLSSILRSQAFLLLILSTPTFAIPINKRQQLPVPAIASHFPDPSIIQVDGMWWAFVTQSIYDHKDIRVQVVVSSD